MANNVVSFNPAQLPAHLRGKEPSALTKALAGSGGSGKRLSIKGGVFRLIVDGKEVSAIEERYLDVVIVAGAPKIGRTWYAKKWTDGDTVQAPDCWSADGGTPDATSKTPQHATCDGCQQNIKGSGEGDSKACRYSQRVAVVLANDMEGSVLQLSVPAQSLFGKEEGGNHPLQSYARQIMEAKADVGMLITRLKFDMKSESPKLFFKAMRYLEADEYEVCVKQGQTEDAKRAITMTVAAHDGAPAVAPEEPPAPPPKATAPATPPAAPAADVEPPAPAPRRGRKPAAAATPAAPAAPAAPPAAQASDDDDPPPPEPTLRKGNTATVGAGNVASLVANWDD